MEIGDALLALGALAQKARLGIFRSLVVAGESGYRAGELAEKLRLPKPTLSFHLKELTRAGLIRPTREGTALRYAIEVEAVRGLLEFLVKDCCNGRPDLCLSCYEPADQERSPAT